MNIISQLQLGLSITLARHKLHYKRVFDGKYRVIIKVVAVLVKYLRRDRLVAFNQHLAYGQPLIDGVQLFRVYLQSDGYVLVGKDVYQAAVAISQQGHRRESDKASDGGSRRHILHSCR